MGHGLSHIDGFKSAATKVVLSKFPTEPSGRWPDPSGVDRPSGVLNIKRLYTMWGTDGMDGIERCAIYPWRLTPGLNVQGRVTSSSELDRTGVEPNEEVE